MANERKTVIVTGAAGGIGRATCERLSANGWNVLAVDNDADKLAWASKQNIASFVADITSEDDNTRMVAEAEERFGGVHAAAFNAAVTGGGSIDTMPFEKFERVIGINLFGTVRGIRAVLPALRKQKGGAIVVTSSTNGLAGDSENWAYTASKHALIGVVRSLARELGWEGIRVNALCPGPTRGTGMTAAIEDVAPQHYEMLKGQVPLQRWAEPEEMAGVIEFLLSPAASYVNGHAMVADGGAMTGTGLLLPASGKAKAIPDDVKH